MSRFMLKWKHKLFIISAVAGFSVPVFVGPFVETDPVFASEPRHQASHTPALSPASSLATYDLSLLPVQPAVLLSGIKQEYQGWNNCGPATLKMNLSYFGRDDTQKQIAAVTKPYSDDKSVSAEELAAYANQVGMGALVRENGTLERLKLLVSNGMPVIIETGYVTASGREGWMSHFKLLIGYDEKQVIFMDSYAGPDQAVSFETMEANWREVNRRYLIVYPSDREEIVRAIVGDDFDNATMYTHGVERARAELVANPNDAFAYYNLGTNLNGLQQYPDAASAFDQARAIGLPWRMLWYQYGPYVAYLNTGRNEDVIALANATLRTVADLEESHYYKGMALQALGQENAARREFKAALRYNPNYQNAQSALQASLFNEARGMRIPL